MTPRAHWLALGIALAAGACDRVPAPDGSLAAPATTTPPPGPIEPAAPKPTTAKGAEPGFVALDASVIGPDDTMDAARARLGAAEVVAARVPGAEGEEFDGWHVYPDDPKRRLYVYLDDATHRPVLLRVLDVESTWQRGDGIRMGRTLAELAERNGKPVGFTGFDWDYGGGCCDWHGGRLERDPPTGGMTLCPPETDAAVDPDYPMGDAQFDSTNAWVVAHPPSVCEFSLALEPRP
jgi:hypothetical protein